MAIDFKYLGQQLAISVKESPGNDEKDPAVREYFHVENAKRIWEVWTQVQMFDPRDQMLAFSTQCGLPDGVVIRYMDVCRNYQAQRVADRLKKSTPSTAPK